MGLLNRVLNRSDDDGGRPPKPDDEQESKTVEFDVYEVTVHYQNGDAETFECYGRYRSDELTITYNMGPEARVRHSGDDARGTYTFDRRKVNYRVMTREPEETHVRTESWTLSWTTTYEWKTSIKWADRWKQQVTDLSIERTD